MEFVQLLASSGISAGLVAGIFIVFQVVANKKLRTPADRQSEIKNVFEILSGTIKDNQADKAANENTISTLRAYIDTIERDSREDQELIRGLYGQIRELERRNHEKDERIRELEAKLLEYSAKFLNFEPLPDDLEETKSPN